MAGSTYTINSDQNTALNNYFECATAPLDWLDASQAKIAELIEKRERVVDVFRNCESLTHMTSLFTQSVAWNRLFRGPNNDKEFGDQNARLLYLAGRAGTVNRDPIEGFRTILDGIPGDRAGVKTRPFENLQLFVKSGNVLAWRFGKNCSILAR